jgi:hypothetical protein
MLVGKSEVVGDGVRERLGAGIVGEAERDWLTAKVGASSMSEEGSIRAERSVREPEGDAGREAGEPEREGRLGDEGRGAGGVARELGGCPAFAVNWPFFLRVTVGRDFGGMQPRCEVFVFCGFLKEEVTTSGTSCYRVEMYSGWAPDEGEGRCEDEEKSSLRKTQVKSRR